MLLRNEKTSKWSSRMEVEDHYVILLEPGSQYLAHVTPQSGHDKLIARENISDKDCFLDS